MAKLMFIYKDYLIKADCSITNIFIKNSYKVKSTKDMVYIIKYLRKVLNDNTYAVNKLSVFRQVIEWKAYNLLYTFKYKREQTSSVDININESWHRIVLYFILSIFY
jgi:hypothetical protein